MWWPTPRRAQVAHVPAAVARERPPPGPVEHASPGLAALFAALDPMHEQHVLDLGAASGANLHFYGTFARHVRFADLLASPAGSSLPPDQNTSVADLAAVFAREPTPYTVIVAWDALNYLDDAPRRTLVAHLAEHAAPGARCYAIIVETATIPRAPSTFVLLAADRVAQRTPLTVSRPNPRLTPAEVARTLHPFEVARSFVLRHGVREYVAALPG